MYENVIGRWWVYPICSKWSILSLKDDHIGTEHILLAF